ncbi:VOC family protein [Marinicrinis sediminis]|uniref:VOC family protein n=1 Tax=Marinicrinis sediminis TaxID=1652465 RepID=A0ABW5R7J2_9BACL
MKIKSIHHVSLLVTNIERSTAFYKEILQMEELPRPDFDFEGAWLAVGQQQLHLIVHEGQTWREGGIDTRDGHVAFEVADYEETLRWLEQKGIPFKANPSSRAGFPQIFILDPDHNVIELNMQEK